MNNENIKNLFTPVSESLPTGGAYFQFIWSDKFQVDVLDFGYYDQVRKCWFSLLTDNRCHNVTHWLDLSKLITKEEVKTMLAQSYRQGQASCINSLKLLE